MSKVKAKLEEIYKSVFNKVISENNINIELISDIFLELFDEIDFYPKSEMLIYFYDISETRKNSWKYRIDLHDLEDARESDIRTLKKLFINKKLRIKFFMCYDIYDNEDDSDDYYHKYDTRKRKINTIWPIDSIKIPDFPDDFKFISFKEMSVIDSGKNSYIGVVKEFDYIPEIDFSYLSDLPKNIIKDFHEFIVSKNLSDKDVDKLKNIIKKVSDFNEKDK